jgi:hypothetical protein
MRWRKKTYLPEQQHPYHDLCNNAHFREAPPDISKDIFDQLEAIEIPQRWDGQIENY